MSAPTRAGFQLPDMLPSLDRLLAEHGGVLAAGPVIDCLASCSDELHRAGVRAGLGDAAEAMARSGLRRLAGDRAGQAEPVRPAAPTPNSAGFPSTTERPDMSVTPDEVRASTADVSGVPPLPEAQIERMVQAFNRHRSARTPVAAAASTAPASAAPEAAEPESFRT